MRNKIEIRPHEIVAIKGNKETDVVYTTKGIKALIDLGWKTGALDKVKKSPRAQIYYRDARVSLALLVLLLTFACSPDPLPAEKAYTFNVSRSAQSFSAEISWGVNGFDYTDRINAHGYASGFELYPDKDFFFIRVDTDQAVDLSIRLNKTEVRTHQVLEPGILYKIKV